MNNSSVENPKVIKNHFLGEKRNCFVVSVIVISLLVFCLLFLFLLSLPVKKSAYVEDNNKVFREDKLEELNIACKRLSDEKNINVVVVTASPEQKNNKDLADTTYRKKCGNLFVSGICIVIDRYHSPIADLYSYGYATLGDVKEARKIMSNWFASTYAKDDYSQYAIIAVRQIREKCSFHGKAELYISLFCILIPLLFAAAVTHLAFLEKEYGATPTSARYRVAKKTVKSVDERGSFLNDL